MQFVIEKMLKSDVHIKVNGRKKMMKKKFVRMDILIIFYKSKNDNMCNYRKK